MTWKISGQIEATGSDVISLAECRVEVFFEQKTVAESVGLSAALIEDVLSDRDIDLEMGHATTAIAKGHPRASARTDKTGKFEVYVPDPTEIASNKLRFVVSAPSGETIGDASLSIELVQQELRIPVSMLNPILLDPPKETLKHKTRRVTGRLIERKGKSLPSNMQVLLFARKRGENGTKTVGNSSPVFFARADGSGYFSGDASDELFESAAALVTGVAKKCNFARGRLYSVAHVACHRLS